MKNIILLIIISLISCNNNITTSSLKQIAELPKALKEISGIAYRNDLIYCIEDSGNENKVIVIDTLGNTQRSIVINNTQNIDWEDLVFDEIGNLYIGDFGNNDNIRKDLAIYKINKSDLSKASTDVSYKITFDYPEQTTFPPKKKDFMFDVEAFFEYQNNFYLFTKNRSKGFDGTCHIYKVPNKSGHHKAQRIQTIKTCSDYHTCAITSATISPDGSKFVILSHSKIWLFKNYTSNSIADGKMIELNLNHFSQKESICFKNNDILYLADEKVKKSGGNLYEVSLKSLK